MTERTLILVGGLPGTGKSRLCRQILDRFPQCREVSIDPIKEELWDSIGFNDIVEKELLDVKAREVYFDLLDKEMDSPAPILSDYPFSHKQRPRLQELCDSHGFRPITLRLTADLDVLFERQRHRDLGSSRHPGHLLDQYHQGDTIPSRDTAAGLLTKEEFVRRCTTRGYDTFQMGPLKEVDMTDIDHVDRQAILDWIDEAISSPKQ